MSAIPSLHPVYAVTVPTTGEKIKVRPFNVREEKILAMSRLSSLSNDRVTASVEVIKRCVLEGNFDPSKATSIDLEYMTIFIRSKSVGEVVENIRVTDAETGKEYETDVYLEEVYIDPPVVIGQKKLILNEKAQAGVKVDYPLFEDLRQFQLELGAAGVDMNDNTVDEEILDPEAVAKSTFKLYSKMIKMIWIGDEVILRDQIEEDDLIEWIGNLSEKEFAVLEKFLADLPRVRIPVTYINKDTKEKKKVVMTGFEGFFFSSPATSP